MLTAVVERVRLRIRNAKILSCPEVYRMKNVHDCETNKASNSIETFNNNTNRDILTLH